jgi:hypothetical protein
MNGRERDREKQSCHEELSYASHMKRKGADMVLVPVGAPSTTPERRHLPW